MFISTFLTFRTTQAHCSRSSKFKNSLIVNGFSNSANFCLHCIFTAAFLKSHLKFSKTPNIGYFLANLIVALSLLRLAEIITHGQTIKIFERVQLLFSNYRRTCENKTEIYNKQRIRNLSLKHRVV